MTTQLLASRLYANGITLPDTAIKQLCHYHAMLLDYNNRMDLTAVTQEDEMVDRHYVDSLSALKYEVFPSTATRLVDVGTGAGFPGLPLAIACPHLQVTLLDALQKRVDFLQDVISTLSLQNVKAIHMRAEDAASSSLYREQFDIAVARALAALPTLLEYVLPFVKVAGTALLWKGPKVLEELPDSRPVAHLLGAQIGQAIPVSIAGRDWQHLLLPVQKRRSTPRQYPRRSGIPHKQPLKVKLR